MNREDIYKLILNICYNITDIFKEFYDERLISICVFGSVARKTFNPNSDIDILIALEEAPKSNFKRTSEIMPLMNKIYDFKEYEELDRYAMTLSPSFIIRTKQEIQTHPSILIDISQEGLILYDRDDFLSDVLDEIRARLKELGSKKIYTSQGYYWFLKPDIKPGEVVEI